jgi:hypothetical protein
MISITQEVPLNSSDQAFTPIAKELAKFRHDNPRTRRFPLSLWKKIVLLAKQYPVPEIADRLQINEGNLARRIQMLQGNKKSSSKPSVIPQLVEVPLSMSRPCIMELEYPNGIKVRLFAQ